jgi:hypothetical protein
MNNLKSSLLYALELHHHNMSFEALIKFEAQEGAQSYFAPISYDDALSQAYRPGSTLVGYTSIDELQTQEQGKRVTIKKVSIPVLIPIASQGLSNAHLYSCRRHFRRPQRQFTALV